MNVATDRTSVSLLNSRLYSGRDATENPTIVPYSFDLPSGVRMHDAILWHLSESMSFYVQTCRLPAAAPSDATTYAVVPNSWVLHIQGNVMRIDAQENLSDFTQEPSGGRRWMSIVREGLGELDVESAADDLGFDLVFEGKATTDCVRFCNKHRILSDLRSCLDKVTELFSGVVAFKAEFDQFPSDEYEEEGHVVIRVEVASEQDKAFQDYDSYTDWMLDNIDAEKRHRLFVTFSRTV